MTEIRESGRTIPVPAGGWQSTSSKLGELSTEDLTAMLDAGSAIVLVPIGATWSGLGRFLALRKSVATHATTVLRGVSLVLLTFSGTLFYSALLFGGFELLRRRNPALRLQTV